LESKKITIIAAWIFLIMLWILSFFGNWDLFLPLFFSVVVLVLTVALSLMPETTSPETKLSEEIDDLKSKIEATSKDVEEIRKIIEE
jgi:hypothetical protein